MWNGMQLGGEQLRGDGWPGWRSRWRSTTTTNLTTTHTNANLVIATATHQLTNTKQNMSDALWVESNVFQNDIEVSLNETAATKAPVTKAPRSRWVILGDIVFDAIRSIYKYGDTSCPIAAATAAIHTQS